MCFRPRFTRPLGLLSVLLGCQVVQAEKPNILLIISDDHTYAHTSMEGCAFVDTPHMEAVANQGVYFAHAYATSPGCSPSRASILTGKYTWQLEEAGTHASSFPTAYPVYPDLLEAHGYAVGFTGKGWGPGKWDVSGRTRNPAGPAYQAQSLAERRFTGSTQTDYVANFREFLETRPADAPFCFWLGTQEPHRPYERDSYTKLAKRLDTVDVPAFLPDSEAVRGDLLDYAVEIEYLDEVVGDALDLLRARGELENTLIFITADNGMPFPRAKANCYDYGVRVPLVMRWDRQLEAHRPMQAPVSLLDITYTILTAAGVETAGLGLSGRNLLDVVQADEPAARPVFAARERHSSSRYNNWTYPQRAMRQGDFLLIWNLKPTRYPAGDPLFYDAEGNLVTAYTDIDASPTKHGVLATPGSTYYALAVGKRPAYELYNVQVDPYCLHNLIGDPAYAQTERELVQELTQYLVQTGDARLVGDDPDIWEAYPRLSGPMRRFPAPEATDAAN